MNPVALRLRHFRSFVELDVQLPHGCCAIVGHVAGADGTDSNGAGKSSLVNAIELALFGREGDASWDDYLTSEADGDLMVELTFEHRGETYRVRRGFSPQGRKATLDLEKYEGDVYYPLTLDKATETQARLEELLGLTRATFRASSFLMQRDASAFTLAKKGERMDLLVEAVLGLDPIWPKLLERVRRDKNAAVQEIARIDGRLAGVTADTLTAAQQQIETGLSTAAATIAWTTKEIATAEADLERAAAALQEARDQAATRAAAHARVDAAASELAARARIGQEAAAAAEQANLVRAELDKLPATVETATLEERERTLTAAVDTYQAAVREREHALRLADEKHAQRLAVDQQAEAARARAAGLDEKIRHLESGTVDTCPVCEQQLHAGARAATLGSLRAQAQLAVDEAQALQEQAAGIEIPPVPDAPEPTSAAADLEQVRDDLRLARSSAVVRSRLEERLAVFTAAVEKASDPVYLETVAAAEQQLADAKAALEQIPPATDTTPLEQTAVQARARVEQHRAALTEAQQQLAVERERLEQLDQREAQHRQDLAARDHAHVELDQLAILERAYNRDGIPSLLIENAAIPQIEVEANRLLILLGGPVQRVELRTEAVKRDGGTKAALDIVCLLERGERPYGMLSGGEQFRVDLALRLALAQLLATRGGADTRLLVIDEPDGLDASGKQALIGILRDLEGRGLDRLYLISHDSELRDSFDQVLEVVKTDGRSRIAGVGADLQAVA